MSNRLNSTTSTAATLKKTVGFVAVGMTVILASIFLINDGSGGSIEVSGKDGAATITSADSILNQYASLASAVSSGANSLDVTDIADLNGGSALSEDDLVLIIQMQGATVKVASDSSFGEITSYGEAGNYEYIFVESVASNQITFKSPLQNSYSSTGKTQVIRVPQYSTLDLLSGASITAPAWDGTTGGVIAFTASDTATIDGTIDVSELGFRGGTFQNTNSYNQYIFYTSDKSLGGEKGESIAGSSADYETAGYRYGRGAIANGGGGGNGHNAGGGGGSNGNSGNTWTGIGVMCQTCLGNEAWALDEEYIEAGAPTSSSGGGRGGYSYSGSNLNALTIAPGTASWGGDTRRNIGGYGGRPLTSDGDGKLFFGGGGGAGHGNNNKGGSGGNGGGLAFIIAKAIKGTGTIAASGEAGASTIAAHNDAPGGGGAGGSIIIKSNYLDGITLNANGGDGGNQLITNNEAEGPGGSGGGGFISIPAGSSVTTSVSGGTAGTTTSASLTEFPTNGATDGASGQIATTIFVHYPQSTNTFPVEWLGVEADWDQSDAVIQWMTASESNSDYFALERSGDGKVFTEISRIQAAGTSDEILGYEMVDPGVADEINSRVSYRLRQVDIDGKFEFSPTVELSLQAVGNEFSVKMFPNPATDLLNLEIEGDSQEIISWQIFTLSGQAITGGSMSMSDNTARARIDISELPAGRYVLSTRGFRESKSSQFIKQ